MKVVRIEKDQEISRLKSEIKKLSNEITWNAERIKYLEGIASEMEESLFVAVKFLDFCEDETEKEIERLCGIGIKQDEYNHLVRLSFIGKIRRKQNICRKIITRIFPDALE